MFVLKESEKERNKKKRKGFLAVRLSDWIGTKWVSGP